MVEIKDVPPVLLPGPDVDRTPLVAPSVITKNLSLLVNVFPIAKLLVGVSVAWSADDTLFKLKLLPLPLESAPNEPALSKFK